MTKQEALMLSKAIAIAATVHQNQLDKGGNPYIFHPLELMRLVESDDPEVLAICVLHDVKEDCPEITYKYLSDNGMSERVLHGIYCLTKVPGETYEEYQQKVASNRDSILVKMADLTHNSDLRRLKGVQQKDFERVVKYMQFHYYLKNVLSEM